MKHLVAEPTTIDSKLKSKIKEISSWDSWSSTPPNHIPTRAQTPNCQILKFISSHEICKETMLASIQSSSLTPPTRSYNNERVLQVFVVWFARNLSFVFLWYLEWDFRPTNNVPNSLINSTKIWASRGFQNQPLPKHCLWFYNPNIEQIHAWNYFHSVKTKTNSILPLWNFLRKLQFFQVALQPKISTRHLSRSIVRESSDAHIQNS